MIQRSPARVKTTAAALLLGTLAMPRSARAQTLPLFDARTLRPSVDPDAALVLEPSSTPGHLEWNVGLWSWYAQGPVFVHGGAPQLHPVNHQVGADMVADLGLGSRFAVGVDLPFYLWQDGDASVPATGIGDVGLEAKATVISNEKQQLRAGLGLAVIADATFATASRSSFMGDGAVTASLRWLAEYSLGVASLRASIGFLWRPDWRMGFDGASEVTVGDALPWSIGLVLRPKALVPSVDPANRQEWELAAHGSLPAAPEAPFGWGGSARAAAALSPALVSIDDRIQIGRRRDLSVILGADVGVDAAVGVPLARAVVSLGWAPRVHDRDGDGVPDDVDQCPDLPEDKDGVQDNDGCPEDDADGDGIPDDEDACPLVAGLPSSDPKRNGCPGPGGAGSP